MEKRHNILWFVIMLCGSVVIALMGFVLTNSIVQSRQQGHVNLSDGDILVVESRSEMRMLSEEGAKTCIIPVGSDTPELCTEEFMDRFYIAQGVVDPGEYLVQGNLTYFYLPDSRIPDKYGMMARQLIGVSIIVVFYLSLMTYLYFKLR